MDSYLWIMLAGTVLTFFLYGLYCTGSGHAPELRKKAWLTALLSLVFASVFGVILARLSYALLMQELDFEYDGIEALEQLLWFDIDCVSFFGGAVGVVLGVRLACRLTVRNQTGAAMDAFAPFGALLVALFRTGEIAFGSYGAGNILPEGSRLAFFPFALRIEVDGGYSYWGWAICVLSAVFALVWAVIAFLRRQDRKCPGFLFELTLFFLALPQVICESLRKRGMFWLFVHTEQLLCVVLILALMIFWILRSGKELSAVRRWLPLGISLLCVGALVATEFAIDGKIFDFSHGVCYAFMILVLIVMGICGCIAAKRRKLRS